MPKTTEADSLYHDLEQQPIGTLLQWMNEADQAVPRAVQASLPQIEAFLSALVPRLLDGGRLFYIGAGTSGRLGILDASECPPTFGVPPELVTGLIAGGDGAIRTAVEFAEDDTQQAWKDLEVAGIQPGDSLVGLSASGTTPYVLGGLRQARAAGVLTSCIVCNEGSPIALAAEHPIECIVGPEFITGSTRLKAGTAQKLILNMLSTISMIQLGRVQGNRMVDMQLSNAKLVERGTRYVMQATGLPQAEAEALLKQHGSVRAAIAAYTG